MQSIKRILTNLLPYGAVTYLQTRRAIRELPHSSGAELSEAKITEILAGLGLDLFEVSQGSIPIAELRAVLTEVATIRSLDSIKVALHVGNFVGVSLACFAHLLGAPKSEVLVVAIDPNIRHRGVLHPQYFVQELLSRVGLADSVLLVAGFTLAPNSPDDGRRATKDLLDLGVRQDGMSSFTNVLPKLKQLGVTAIDLVYLDGNHDGTYLLQELEYISALLNDNSIVIIDDISSDWPDLKLALESPQCQSRYRVVCQTGRTAIMARR